jgi:hypothetical protein
MKKMNFDLCVSFKTATGDRTIHRNKKGRKKETGTYDDRQSAHFAR